MPSGEFPELGCRAGGIASAYAEVGLVRREMARMSRGRRRSKRKVRRLKWVPKHVDVPPCAIEPSGVDKPSLSLTQHSCEPPSEEIHGGLHLSSGLCVGRGHADLISSEVGSFFSVANGSQNSPCAQECFDGFDSDSHFSYFNNGFSIGFLGQNRRVIGENLWDELSPSMWWDHPFNSIVDLMNDCVRKGIYDSDVDELALVPAPLEASPLCSVGTVEWLSLDDPLSEAGPEESGDFEVVSRWVLEKMRLVAKSAGISFREVEKEAIHLFSLLEQRRVVSSPRPKRSPASSRRGKELKRLTFGVNNYRRGPSEVVGLLGDSLSLNG